MLDDEAKHPANHGVLTGGCSPSQVLCVQHADGPGAALWWRGVESNHCLPGFNRLLCHLSYLTVRHPRRSYRVPLLAPGGGLLVV